MSHRRPLWVLVLVAAVACSGQSETASTPPPPPVPFTLPPLATVLQRTTSTTDPTATSIAELSTSKIPATVMVGAASRSVLPTVLGTRSYMSEVPGWNDISPDDPGAFFGSFDQGQIDVGNGGEDAAWIHDDLRVTAVAIAGIDIAETAAAAPPESTTTTIDRFAVTTSSSSTTSTSTTTPPSTSSTAPPRPTASTETVVMVSADVYMIFAADAAEIERRAKVLIDDALVPDDSLRIIISATHNHHGPDTGFNINDEWYSLMADEAAAAIAEAVEEMEPAELVAASGKHRFGMADTRDPLLVDPRLNVMQARRKRSGKPIATIVQWANHPETTLGWSPSGNFRDECSVKGWKGKECTAEGRYLTADYPGVLRDRLERTFGGEVLYFNGALGSQIGPGEADVWRVDEENPVGDGVTPPLEALYVGGAEDFRERNFARTQTIGDQLATAALLLIVDEAQPVTTTGPVWKEQSFYTSLTNIGFRVLLASGGLGWQSPTVYNCGPRPYTDETCVSDQGLIVDDPVLTPLTGDQIRGGDVFKSRLAHVDFGDVGFLFMPGELPPEIVIGLPLDFNDNSAIYYADPALHAVGAAYEIPQPLAKMTGDLISFTVGLGGDELGYWVPINEVRLKCDNSVLGDIGCRDLYEAGFLVAPDAVGGPSCKQLADNPSLTIDDTPELPYLQALALVCRYGQAIGRELGEPEGHYEETNSASWDLVADLAMAADQLFAAP
jgi:hypothetical protein